MDAVKAMIAEARKHVGYKEAPVNRTKFGRAYGMDGVPWCQIFISIVAQWSGNKSAVPRTAACRIAVAWFKQRGRFTRTAPKVGDLIFYTAASRGGTHVELVTKVTGRWVYTIGGNTSGADKLGRVNPEGNGVYIKRLSRANPRIYGYGHPLYSAKPGKPTPRPTPRPAPKPPPRKPAPKPAPKPRPKPAAAKAAAKGPPKWPGRVLRYRKGAPMMSGKDVASWQRQMRRRGFKIAADGLYGPGSAAAARQLQRRARIGVDGQVGPATWRATFR